MSLSAITSQQPATAVALLALYQKGHSMPVYSKNAKKENRTAGSFVHRSPLKDNKKPRWDFFLASVQLKYCLYCPLLPGASLKICWEKRKSSASRLDTKYLWRMIYIIKEHKSPEFTWLVTQKSGGVNVASHICSCSANHANSRWWMEERRGERQQRWHESAPLTLFVQLF